MRNVIRVALALGALVLVGCGGRPLAPGKEAAAGALFQASRGALNVPGSGGLAEVLTSAAFGEVRVNCARGGSLAIQVNVSGGEQTSLGYDLSYDNCSQDGHTSLRGTLHVTMEVINTQSSVSVGLHMVGRVDFSGEISDHIDADITEQVTQTDLASPGYAVNLTLHGTISTSAATYTFDHELVVVDGLGLQAAPPEG
jgi:hypothetical protein